MPSTLPWTPLLDRGNLTVLLVRHGRTQWNAQRRFLGATDIELDEHGRSQAETLREVTPLELAGLYSSPLSRAWQTASVFGEPELIPELAELSQGELEGLDGPTAMERYGEFFAEWAADPEKTRVPGGESLGDLRERALPVLERLVHRHPGPALVGVFTHQMVIAVLTCSVLGLSLDQWRECGVRNAAITVLGWDGSRWAVHARGWETPALKALNGG